MLWGKYKVWTVKTYKQGVKQTNYKGVVRPPSKFGMFALLQIKWLDTEKCLLAWVETVYQLMRSFVAIFSLQL